MTRLSSDAAGPLPLGLVVAVIVLPVVWLLLFWSRCTVRNNSLVVGCNREHTGFVDLSAGKSRIGRNQGMAALLCSRTPFCPE